MTEWPSGYPVNLEVNAPTAQGRLSILLRVILTIPHTFILYALWLVTSLLVMLSWFTIVIAGRFPTVMLRFTIGTSRWTARVNAYSRLLTSKYPPFSMREHQDYPIRLSIPERATGRNWLTTFFRIILVVPHVLILQVLSFISSFVLLGGWLAGLWLGRIPNGIHEWLSGFSNWSERYSAYSTLLVDEYPPFTFR